MRLLRPSLVAVNLVWFLQSRFSDIDAGAPGSDRAKKARIVTLRTGGAGLFDLNQERVAIAIEGDVLDHLDMAAAFAFHPELLARTAPEMRFARGNSFLDRSAVHPRHHQDAPRGLFLDDRRDQAIAIEFQFVV